MDYRRMPACSLPLSLAIATVTASVMTPPLVGSTAPANRPGRIGFQERPGSAEANRHLGDALRRMLRRGIILGMLRVKGFLDAVRRALDRDGRSPDDSAGSRRDRVDTDAGIKSYFLAIMKSSLLKNQQ